MAELPSEEMSASMSISLDDFTHLSTYKSMSASMNSNSLLNKSLFGQVVFHDLSDVYPTDSEIKCRYSLTDNVSPQPGDKIALFKVGWLSVSEYITFERAQLPSETGNTILQVTFPAESLPKDDVHVYQLCYVTSGNVIAGASIPFAFRRPHESELIAVEDPADPDLVVFKSRVTQLQDDLNKATEEKYIITSKMESELQFIKNELNAATAEKEKALQEVEEVKLNLKEITGEKKILEEKMANNPYEKTLEYLKAEMSALDAEKNKAQQLLSEKISEIQVNMGTIECLKQDFQHVESNLKEHIKTNENLVLEKESLKEKLKYMAEMHNAAVVEKLNLELELEKYQDMPQDRLKRALLKSEDEKAIMTAQLMSQKESSTMREEQFLKIEQGYVSEIGILQSSVKLLTKQLGDKQNSISSLKSEVEGLKSSLNNVKVEQETTNLGSIPQVFSTVTGLFNALHCPPEVPKASTSKENSGDKGGSKSTTSKLHTVLQEKAELRAEIVQVRHEQQELSRVLKDTSEENAALKSRIGVLEYELSTSKSALKLFSQNKQHITSADMSGPSSLCSDQLNEMKEAIDKFVEHIPVVTKFNSLISEKLVLEQQLEQERLYKAALQIKVEDLMMKDSQLCMELQSEKEERKRLATMIEDLQRTVTGESVQLMQKLLDDMDIGKTDLEQKLATAVKEKDSAEKQLMSLRKEIIGKVSFGDDQFLRGEIAALKMKLDKEVCCAETKLQLQAASRKYSRLYNKLKLLDPKAAEDIDQDRPSSGGSSSNMIMVCPLCSVKFPPGSFHTLHKHLECHMD